MWLLFPTMDSSYTKMTWEAELGSRFRIHDFVIIDVAGIHVVVISIYQDVVSNVMELSVNLFFLMNFQFDK